MWALWRARTRTDRLAFAWLSNELSFLFGFSTARIFNEEQINGLNLQLSHRAANQSLIMTVFMHKSCLIWTRCALLNAICCLHTRSHSPGHLPTDTYGSTSIASFTICELTWKTCQNDCARARAHILSGCCCCCGLFWFLEKSFLAISYTFGPTNCIIVRWSCRRIYLHSNWNAFSKFTVVARCALKLDRAY